MLLVISPAKNLDYDSPLPTQKNTKAEFLAEAGELMGGLKQLAPQDISQLMGISDKLGLLNYDRFQQWALPMTKANARQAILAFKGDVYVGLDAYSFSDEDFNFAQQHLRILSGLYGVLKPLDLMAPYRLEMGTRYRNPRGRDLYSFWSNDIAPALDKQLKKLSSDTLVNLASNEYFKAVDRSRLSANVITPVFKDWKNGTYKIISFYAKKARGRMSAYIIKNKITNPDLIKRFDWDGYQFNDAMSDAGQWVFTRQQ